MTAPQSGLRIGVFLSALGQEAGWISKEVRLCTMFVMDTLH